MRDVIISGSFDDIRLNDIELLRTANQSGRVNLLLWTDSMHTRLNGEGPKFCLKERRYFTEAVKYVNEVAAGPDDLDPDVLPHSFLSRLQADPLWLVTPENCNEARKEFCRENGIELRTIEPARTVPVKYAETPTPDAGNRKKIIVTGCYDYFHTGHIRFFEEVSEHGELYVVIGSDKNVELLKGEGHPHYSEDERLAIVQSIKFVKNAYVSTGTGWMDAEPEISILKPDIYAVNEDGDKPEKREFCEKHGLQYLILKRTPKEGLPARSSTELRGF